MYLFILESLGMQELILIGVIALVVFGPRKLPEMAKKFGSMMSEFRKVSGEFRSTWENAVDLENLEEPKSLEESSQTDAIDEMENSIGQIEPPETNGNSDLPEIRNVSKEEFDEIITEKKKEASSGKSEINNAKENIPASSEKTDWL